MISPRGEVGLDQPAADTDFLLAALTGAAIDSAGDICIVDFKQENLQIFDARGNWLMLDDRTALVLSTEADEDEQVLSLPKIVPVTSQDQGLTRPATPE